MRLTVEELRDDLERKNDINIYISDRSGWKSTTCQLFLVDEALKGKPFILLRSKIDEKISKSWFSEYSLQFLQERKLQIGEEKINNYITLLFLIDENENKYPLCYGLYVSVAKKYKSNYFTGFEKVKYIVWEECIPNNSLVQNVSYCREKYLEELRAVLSIGSTVSRGRDVQYIFLGNDIPNNIINSITVSFNLLERLNLNEKIEDSIYFDDKKYTFLFYYFDFENSVNHWITDLDRAISKDIDVKKLKVLPYILVTEYNTYFCYNADKFIYISSKKHNKVESLINNDYDFFHQYGSEELLQKYPLKMALKILMSFYNISQTEIELYYGEFWEYYEPKFRKLTKMHKNSIINIDDITNMKYSQIYSLSNYSDICSFYSILCDNSIIYENIAIKLKCEELKTLFLFSK